MPELDTLRGVAITGVLFLHGFYWQFDGTAIRGISGIFFRATGWGWAGVNLFFVLSGFLITGILLDSRQEDRFFANFYTRRALRILPAYYGLLVLLAIAKQASWRYLGLSFLYLANVTPLFGVSPDYGPLWSLAVEEHFYLFWPAFAKRLSPKCLGILSLSVFSAIPLFRLLAFRAGVRDGLSTYTWLSGDGLALGAAIACFVRVRLVRSEACRLCLALFAFGTLATAVGAPFGIMTRRRIVGAMFQYTVVNCFCAAVLISFLLLGTSRWRKIVNVPALQFLGYISYGLYLIHLLIFHAYDAFLTLAHDFAPADFGYMVCRFAIVVTVATIIAFISRRYFEDRFLKLKEKLIQRQTPKHSSIRHMVQERPIKSF